MSVSNSSSRFQRSKVLVDGLKRLQDRFVQVSTSSKNNNNDNNNNNNGTNVVFPLFSPKIQQSIWNTAPTLESQRRQAAILVPLVCYEGEPSLLFTTRASHLSSHASEISYPGGHYDSAIDKTLEDTALRETREELVRRPDDDNDYYSDGHDDDDYPWDEIQIIGRTTSLPSIGGTPVTPIIGVFVHEMDRTNLFKGSPEEVQDVFCVSIQELLDVETSEPNERFRSSIPVYPTKDGTKRIWGLTAVVTRPLLHKLFKPVFFPQYNKVTSL